MNPRVTDVRHLGDFRLEISFSDGVTGVLDFWPRIMNRRGVVEPLHDRELFRQVRVDFESGTHGWPNHVDLCPDQLYCDVQQVRAPGKQVDVS